VTSLVHAPSMRGFLCDRCARWEVGLRGVGEPDCWAEDRAADAHLCPQCVIDRPAWSPADVDRLRRRATAAIARSIALGETYRALQAQALHAHYMRAGRSSLTCELPAVASSARMARNLVRTFAEPAGSDPVDLALLTTELVTNAIRHSGLQPDQNLRVSARRDRDTIHVSVRDRGPGVAPDLPRTRADTPRGRGLRIVEAGAQTWGSGRGVVWFSA
jgi:anti-sigma regulatory factor (Ser/Thr protein kinase)